MVGTFVSYHVPQIKFDEVLFKRKPVQYAPLPPYITDDSEVSLARFSDFPYCSSCFQVWSIEETGEVFTSYEEYLKR